MNRWTSLALHEELAFYYRNYTAQYPGAVMPTNTFTQNLWMKIAEVEEQESRERASRR
jgi:hypothetical protein